MRRTLATLGLVVALGAGCGEPAPAPPLPDGPYSMRGRVTTVDRAGEQIGSFFVEDSLTGRRGGAGVAVSQGTSIVRGGRLLDFNALRTGQTVRVWFEGPMTADVPPSGFGRYVVIE